MNVNFSKLIDGVKVSATFKSSKIACPDYDGHLVIDLEGASVGEVFDTEDTMAFDHIVTFGSNPNQFVINYVKSEDCESIFDNVCDAVEFSYCQM
jgi:hypothetical protein